MALVHSFHEMANLYTKCSVSGKRILKIKGYCIWMRIPGGLRYVPVAPSMFKKGRRKWRETNTG